MREALDLRRRGERAPATEEDEPLLALRGRGGVTAEARAAGVVLTG